MIKHIQIINPKKRQRNFHPRIWRAPVHVAVIAAPLSADLYWILEL